MLNNGPTLERNASERSEENDKARKINVICFLSTQFFSALTKE